MAPHQGQKDLGTSYQMDTVNKKVGILTFSKYPYDEADLAILHEAKAVLQAKGLTVVDIEIKPNPMKNDLSMIPEFKHDLNRYLQSVSGYTKMTSLADIIAFNKEDPEKRLKYGQTILEAAELTSGDLSNPEYLEIRNSLLKEANRLEILMKEQAIDALISTKWTSYAPIAGNPSICVPAKALVDLVPKSLIFVGKKWDDATLIAIAHTYEQATLHRIPPTLDFIDKK
jgi:amidase